MFSTSTMASSTTSPIATARPPRIMPLIVTPHSKRTVAAATIDSGSAVRLMIARRGERRNATRIKMTSTAPIAMSRASSPSEV